MTKGGALILFRGLTHEAARQGAHPPARAAQESQVGCECNQRERRGRKGSSEDVCKRRKQTRGERTRMKEQL